MEWLKDKKNQPIVAAVLAVVILGAGAAVYFTMFAGGGGAATSETAAPPATTADQTQTTGMPADTSAGSFGAPGTAPGAAPGTTPGQPGAAQGAQAAAPAAAPPGGARPMEVWRSDPFLPIGYKPPPKNKPKPKPRIPDLPFGNFSQVPAKGREELVPDLVQPVRRMAGLIQSDRIYAIIETVGKPNMEIVQPGDTLEDGLAKVERIERDKVILKTKDKVPKYLTVRLTSAPRAASSATSTPTTGPQGPPMPTMMPGGRPRGPYGAGAGEPMAPM